VPPPGSGFFDTLLYNERGEVTEFTKGNLVVELDGQRLTPALSCGLLPGTLRAELLARGEVREALLQRADMERASALWFVNGVRGMVPARLS
jgi:para-aminobenzoate synthetase/4-amino-4-deoxychorismate lyase